MKGSDWGEIEETVGKRRGKEDGNWGLLCHFVGG